VVRGLADYSGGPATDSHRLPYHPPPFPQGGGPAALSKN
jgi:hypothetical protein